LGQIGRNFSAAVAIEKKRGKTSLCSVANKKFHFSPEADSTIWKKFDAHFDFDPENSCHPHGFILNPTFVPLSTKSRVQYRVYHDFFH
jgi:hypothetical protein